MADKIDNDVVMNHDGTGYIFSIKAAVVVEDSSGLIDYEVEPVNVPGDKFNNKKYVPWGEDNDLPQQLISKVKKSEVVGAGLEFNINAGYGDGIHPMRRILDKVNGKSEIKWEPVIDNTQINDFFEANDINGYLLEQLTDLKFFHNVFPLLILNKGGDKINELVHLEAAFSRWGEMNKKGIIEDHYYSTKWDDNATDEDIEHTPVLNFRRPYYDLKEKASGNRKRYVMPVRIPSPGSNYYSWAYWHAIFESGWYDFAVSIPEFKKAKITNEMTVKYVIYLAEDYFTKIFSEEGITGTEEQKERKKKEFNNIKNFISGAKNAGKSLITYFRYSHDGKPMDRIRIEVLNSKKEGGEYLEDSEEVSNMMSFALGVHPSLIGSTPGKNKGSFSGTDKRELFIIKQALMKPVRDILLKPLYLVKQFNGWDKDVFFHIPNITLTTLDEGKEKQKVIMTNDNNE